MGLLVKVLPRSVWSLTQPHLSRNPIPEATHCPQTRCHHSILTHCFEAGIARRCSPILSEAEYHDTQPSAIASTFPTAMF